MLLLVKEYLNIDLHGFHQLLDYCNCFADMPFIWCIQVNLVDWLKMMVGSKRSEEVVDPTIETRPSTTALKRALLTTLRCLDPDSDKRPTMSQVVRMLESEEYPIPREVIY